MKAVTYFVRPNGAGFAVIRRVRFDTLDHAIETTEAWCHTREEALREMRLKAGWEGIADADAGR